MFPYKTTCPVALLAQSITSGNLPELPTTATHGLWSYLSGKVFLQGSSAGISCLAIWIDRIKGSLPLAIRDKTLVKSVLVQVRATVKTISAQFLWQLI